MKLSPWGPTLEVYSENPRSIASPITVAAGGAPSGIGGAHSGKFLCMYAQICPHVTPGSIITILFFSSTFRILFILLRSINKPAGFIVGQAKPPESPADIGETAIFSSEQ